MVKLVALVGHRHRMDDLAKGWRAGLHIDDRKRVGFGKVRAKQQRVGEVLRRSLHCELRRCVKSRIRPHWHWSISLFAFKARNCLLSIGLVRGYRPKLITETGT